MLSKYCTDQCERRHVTRYRNRNSLYIGRSDEDDVRWQPVNGNGMSDDLLAGDDGFADPGCYAEG